jgi:hypothetical protein
VAELFTEVVGVDPNPQVASNPSLTDHWVGTVEDFAKTYCGPPFDAACSIYVVEHVKEPVSAPSIGPSRLGSRPWRTARTPR